VKKETIVKHLLKPPCVNNKEFSCLDCALRFTHLCDPIKLHNVRRKKIKANIIANIRGFDYISKEKCQITVLREELFVINNELN